MCIRDSIDSLDACDEVQILSSTDGWYSVSYGGGKTGFVKASEITNDKELAEYNAMHYDNYKQAKVKQKTVPLMFVRQQALIHRLLISLSMEQMLLRFGRKVTL